MSATVIYVFLRARRRDATDRFSKSDPFTQTLHEGIIAVDHALVIPNNHLLE